MDRQSLQDDEFINLCNHLNLDAQTISLSTSLFKEFSTKSIGIASK